MLTVLIGWVSATIDMIQNKNVNIIFSEINTMPLKLSDFDEVKINWIKKFINLKEIAKNYNLGLDSFVFVDDQKFESFA